MKIAVNTVDEYIEAAPAERQAVLRRFSPVHSYQPSTGSTARPTSAKAVLPNTVSDRALMMVSITGRPRALTRPTGIMPQRILRSPVAVSASTACPGAILRRGGSSATASAETPSTRATCCTGVVRNTRPGIG